MKISTKGRYALRLMMDLAENNTGSPISLKDVAKGGQNLVHEINILEQIIIHFKQGGLRQKCQRRPGRLHAEDGTAELHSRHDSQTDRGQPCAGSMYRG